MDFLWRDRFSYGFFISINDHVILVPGAVWMLPAGAFAGWGLHPLESTALSRRTRQADIADQKGFHPRTEVRAPLCGPPGLFEQFWVACFQ
jgi:hypothetical protein